MYDGYSGVVLALLIALLAGEFLSFIGLYYVKPGLWKPRYARSHQDWQRLYTESNDWGPWRLPNCTVAVQGNGRVVTHRSNAYGARDRERDREKPDARRVVVLGDSMTEGAGVDAEERLTDLLEERLGIEFLNFAIGRDFGPLQYQIIYDQLASTFSHDHVMICLMPYNDFTDNDPAYWKRASIQFTRRYRPYYGKRDPAGYSIVYAAERPVRSGGRPGSPRPSGFLRLLLENTWSFGMYGYLRGRSAKPRDYSGYLDFTAGQLECAFWSFRNIIARAGERPVTIVIIPRPIDYARVQDAGENPLGRAVRAFGQEQGVQVVDLLDLMPRIDPNYDAHFIPRDGHWSPLGNRIAAEALLYAVDFARSQADEVSRSRRDARQEVPGGDAAAAARAAV